MRTPNRTYSVEYFVEILTLIIDPEKLDTLKGKRAATPRSVCPELNNKIYNLEMMPLTLNQRKGAKVTQQQIDLAKRWNQDGLLSDVGLGAMLEVGKAE